MGIITGRVLKFGDNIDTDQIYPGRYLDLNDHREIAAHVMEGADTGFRRRYRPGDIIVAGRNFGCGSSREHAVIALKAAGICLVAADSFARIFFRNAVNAALPILIVPGVSSRLDEGEEIAADFTAATLTRMNGDVLQGQPLSDYVLQIYRHGGIIRLFQEGKAISGA